MCSRALIAAAASAVVLGLAAVPAMARQNYQFLPDDATNPLPLFGRPPMIVGYANEADWTARVNGTSPRIDYASFSSTPQLSSYNSSVVSYSRTAIVGPVTAYDTSTVSVTNGATGIAIPYRGGFNALNQSTLNLSGRITIASTVYAADDATVNVSGVTFSIDEGGRLQTEGRSTVNFTSGSLFVTRLGGRSTTNISGGTANILDLRDDAAVNISGGTITGGVYCRGNNNVVNITGGSVHQSPVMAGYEFGSGSTVNFSGGTVASLQAYTSSTINITGGTLLGEAIAGAGSTVNVSGGTFVPRAMPFMASFWVYTDPNAGGPGGVLNFFGTDLVLTQLADEGFATVYGISGTLQDGTVMSNVRIQLYIPQRGEPPARIVLNNIPDPAVLSVALPLAMLGRRRRRFR